VDVASVQHIAFRGSGGVRWILLSY